MRTIYKYPLPFEPDFTIDLPVGATLLHIDAQDQSQPGQLSLWAMVDTDQPIVKKRFAIIGTGHEIPPGIHALNHFATVLVGNFVWHVFTPLEKE